MFKSARIFILLLLLGSGLTLFSQQLSHQVLVPVAGVVAISGINYSQTTGETAVEIINSFDYTFTQGFQQPCMQFKIDIPHEGNGVDVFPNPAIDHITVKLFGDVSRDFRIELINITGTVVASEDLTFTDSFYVEKLIPITHLNKGLYFIRVLSTDKLISRTFKVEKM